MMCKSTCRFLSKAFFVLIFVVQGLDMLNNPAPGVERFQKQYGKVMDKLEAGTDMQFGSFARLEFLSESHLETASKLLGSVLLAASALAVVNFNKFNWVFLAFVAVQVFVFSNSVQCGHHGKKGGEGATGEESAPKKKFFECCKNFEMV